MGDDLKLQNYQDDFDSDDGDSDDFLDDVTDDPASELGISRRELKEGLDRSDFHADGDSIDIEEPDDWRERVEDQDEADDNSALSYLNK